MTLTEIVNMIFTNTGDLTVFCFMSEESRDNYRAYPNDGGLEFAFRSPLKCNVFLNERFANAEVMQIYPVSNRIVDVVLKGD